MSCYHLYYSLLSLLKLDFQKSPYCCCWTYFFQWISLFPFTFLIKFNWVAINRYVAMKFKKWQLIITLRLCSQEFWFLPPPLSSVADVKHLLMSNIHRFHFLNVMFWRTFILSRNDLEAHLVLMSRNKEPQEGHSCRGCLVEDESSLEQ